MTDTSKADIFGDIFRMIAGLFDRPAYWLLGLIYQIFFNVSSADLFNNATILGFYKRIQLIIGVFMIFQLAVTIIKGIVNPEEAFGAKSGLGSIITRVIMALVLMTVLVPVSIPGADTEYERQINNNGLLFGTLYSLQHRILANNTLGRLVLGTTDETVDSGLDSEDDSALTGADKQAESLKRSSRIFTSTILKGFIRINLVPEEYREEPTDGRSEEMLNANRICKDIDDDVLEAYTKIDADPGEIISLLTEKCTVDKSEDWYQKKYGKDKYVFANVPIISAVVAFIFVFVLLSYTIEVTIRAVKLAVLRLIAPIPIISYMNPSGSKDGAFNSWVKALTSTYLDLFVRLAIIYFVIYLIQDMIVNGIVMNTGSGMVGVLSAIAIWIGLFAFAKQAPKFIRQVLGMKEDSGSGLFKGFSEAAGVVKSAAKVADKVAGVGTAAVGTVGSFFASKRASEMADDANGTNTGTFANKGKHVVAGILGGLAGLGTGLKTVATSKDHARKNTFDTIQKRNATVIDRGSSGSTFTGRVRTNLQRLTRGESDYEMQTRNIENLKSVASTGKALKEYLEDRAVKKGGGFNVTGKLNNGSTFNTTLDEWRNSYNVAKQKGEKTFVVAGKSFNTFSSETSRIDGDLVTLAGQQWAVAEMAKSVQDRDVALVQKLDSFRDSGGANDVMITSSTDPNAIFNSDIVKKVTVGAEGKANRIETSAEYQKAKADYGATKK